MSMVAHDSSAPGMVALSVICGAFLLPHCVGKFTAREASFGFFRIAGLNPPAPFVYVAMVVELAVGICLILGFFVVPAAAIGCAHLLFASAAVAKVERKWLWHLGGCEYPLFWALCCAIVATCY